MNWILMISLQLKLISSDLDLTISYQSYDAEIYYITFERVNRDVIFYSWDQKCQTFWIISQNLNFDDKNETFLDVFFYQILRK